MGIEEAQKNHAGEENMKFKGTQRGTRLGHDCLTSKVFSES